ncbi:MAG: phenylalanine--tRNA ligase subunit beta [Candidatus Omnitrophota bacterium]|jgi:phenylalanyl-tRNA synthetase beta chain|nr:MAG: phenylalanine--tRNA ligase subunit beta [Candidatus Omnitrophota bacterium]
MKIPYSWLAELVDNIPPAEETARLLTMRGFEVEGMESPGEPIKDIFVAKLLKTSPHPDADKLTLCQVADGEKEYEIVCGASNMKAGDTVALAHIGTVLPGNFKLEKRKIRGIYSQGMLCSTRELGLGDDHSGIMILPESYKIGARLIDEMGLNETVFDLNVTPNRPDALCVIGVAREVATYINSAIRLPQAWPIPPQNEPDFIPSVTLEDEDLCLRYTAVVIKDIHIGPSPDWMVRRLDACGVRSINNVVDATNYVLMEYGQPLHAFDLDKLEEQRIVVRRAKAGEKLTTIDGDERELDESMLVIADAKNPVAVAGIMGGLDSEVSESTTSLLLESAYFDPSSVRRTSKRLGLSSEASYRFERGVDFETVIPASWRCAQLIVELAGGAVAGKMGVADSSDAERLNDLKGRTLTLRYSFCDRLLGKSVPREEIERILLSLHCTVEVKNGEQIILRAPAFRNDLRREADLIEEIARLHGYENFTPTLPVAPVKAPEPRAIDRNLTQQLRAYLTDAGLDEAVTLSFADPNTLQTFMLEAGDIANDKTTLLNPIKSNEAVMKTTLLPALLQCAKHNMAHQNSDFGLFEFARRYLPANGEVEEKHTLAAVIVGNPGSGWRNSKTEMDFFDLKGVVEGMLKISELRRYRLLAGPKCLHPKRGAVIEEKKHVIGYFGELHPAVAEQYELTGRVLVFEIDLHPLSDALRASAIKYRPFSAFPAIKRDLALLVPQEITSRQVEDIIRKESGEILEELALFDYYRGKQVPQGKVSLAFRMTYRSAVETLKEETIDAVCDTILTRLQSKLDVQLRS